MSYRSVKVVKGNGGWGDDMILTPTDEQNVVMSVTGGGIHPVAARIAELTGARAVDGFTNQVEDSTVLAAVINCGGTARIGIYPKKRIHTIDVYPGSPTGPLAKYITADIFVSAVGPDQISLTEPVEALGQDEEPGAGATEAGPSGTGQAGAAPQGAGRSVTARSGADQDGATSGGAGPEPSENPGTTGSPAGRGGPMGVVVAFGNAVGYVINTLLSSGRQALDIILKTVLPFMAYVGLLMGIVNYTGISQLIAHGVTPLAGNPVGLVLLGVIVTLPFLSPVLGPGAAIAQVVGVLMGQQIGAGSLPVQYALPTLFAIDGQAGCDFVPVGLSLGEAQPETISVGVSAVLFTRLVTSPVAVIIAYLASFLLV